MAGEDLSPTSPLEDNLAMGHGFDTFLRLRHCWESDTQLTSFPLN